MKLKQVRGKKRLKDRWTGQAVVPGRDPLRFKATYCGGMVTVDLPGAEVRARVEDPATCALALWEHVEMPIVNAVSSYLEPIVSKEQETESALTEWAAKYDGSTGRHALLPGWRERFGIRMLSTAEFADETGLRKGEAFALLAWLNRRGEVSVVRDADGSPLGWHLYP